MFTTINFGNIICGNLAYIFCNLIWEDGQPTKLGASFPTMLLIWTYDNIAWYHQAKQNEYFQHLLPEMR